MKNLLCILMMVALLYLVWTSKEGFTSGKTPKDTSTKIQATNTALTDILNTVTYRTSYESMINDLENTHQEQLRKKLHETLDKVFDNPEMYQVKGEKGVMIRGAFEVVESPLGIEKTKLFGLETENETHFPAFFFEKDEENSKDGEPNLKLSKMDIPINLKEKYLEEIGHKKSIFNIKREEIKEFLNTQK